MAQKVIWKYPIPDEVKGSFALDADPQGRILSLQVQSGVPVLWMLVDPTATKKRRSFYIVGTGQTFEATGTYVGTYLLQHGQLVWHVFETTSVSLGG